MSNLPHLYFRHQGHSVLIYRPTEDGGTEYLGKIEGMQLLGLSKATTDALTAWVVDGRVSGRIK